MTSAPISFWCRRRLNPRYLIQPSDILSVELTGTHNEVFFFIIITYYYYLRLERSIKDCGNQIRVIYFLK